MSREMAFRSRTLFVGMTALAALAVVAFAPPAHAQRNLTHQIDSTFAFGRNGWVDVTTSAGTVIVNGWTRPEARIQARADRAWVDASLTSSRVTVVTRSESSSRSRGRADIQIEINVPIGTRVLVSTASGDIRVRGTTAEVQANSSSGRIEVVDAADRIRVQSVSGNLHLERIRGRTSIGTTSGDLDVNDLSGAVDVHAVSSTLKLRNVESSDVRIGTTNGDVTYEGTVDPKGSYEIATHSGDVTFAIPTGTGASLSLQTFSGDIHSAFPMTLQPGMNLKQKQHGRRMEFEVGGGGARVNLTTFSGDIRIERGNPRAKPPEFHP